MKLISFLSSLVTVSGLRIIRNEDIPVKAYNGEPSSGAQRVSADFDQYYSYTAQITTGEMFCAGAIISANYIISVAHCFEEGLEGSDVHVRVGSRERGSGTEVPIEKIEMHPNYVYPENNLDIAYLMTQAPIQFNGHSIQRAVLVDGPLPHHVTMSGWGQRNYSPMLEDDLRSVALTTDVKDCQSAYSEVRISANMFCAERDTSMPNHDQEDDTCKGFEGGPASNGFELYGLHSFSRDCGAPSVFTRLSSDQVRLFITEETGVKYSRPAEH